MTPVVPTHIAATPGICGGKPCLAGTRIRVQDVYVWHELQGRTPDEIVSAYPQLTLADVHAALTYYWDNRADIERDMREADSLLDAVRQANPSKLQQKLAASAGDADPVSS
jgi:uncharacterized protein (DUF433 family)